MESTVFSDLEDNVVKFGALMHISSLFLTIFTTNKYWVALRGVHTLIF